MLKDLKNIQSKLASFKKASLDVPSWQELLACARVIYFSYQTAHWLSKGEEFYGDHLLFQRLYEGVAIEIDQIAERAIGTSNGDAVATNTSVKLMVKWVDRTQENFVEGSIAREKEFLEMLKKADGKDISVGTRDLLNGIASTHEEHLYLLQRRESTKK